MHSFKGIFDLYNWDDVQQSILSKTAKDVEAALKAQRRTLEDFKALISPAATPLLLQYAHQMC